MSQPFDLNKALADWRRDVSRTRSLQDDDLIELELHLRDQIDDLERTGLSDEESLLVARHRLGPTAEIAVEFRKVKPSVTWRAPLFWILAAFFVWPLFTHALDLLVMGVIALGGAAGWPMGMLHVAVAATIVVAPLLGVALTWAFVTRYPVQAISQRAGTLFLAGFALLHIAARISGGVASQAAADATHDLGAFSELMTTSYYAGLAVAIACMALCGLALARLRPPTDSEMSES